MEAIEYLRIEIDDLNRKLDTMTTERDDLEVERDALMEEIEGLKEVLASREVKRPATKTWRGRIPVKQPSHWAGCKCEKCEN